MSHKIYHTEGFVLSSRPFGEANKIFKILTPDLGLVSCLAQGIRLEKSKLRFALIGRRFVEVSLVRGREYWRLVHVGPNEVFPAASFDRQTNLFLSKIAAFLSRFIHGEKSDPHLYWVLKAAAISWQDFQSSEPEIKQSLEVLTMLRLLAELGYQPSDKTVSTFIEDEKWEKEILANFHVRLPEAISSINLALRNSQL